MNKKIKVRKTVKIWRNLQLEVSFAQVVKWVEQTTRT